MVDENDFSVKNEPIPPKSLLDSISYFEKVTVLFSSPLLHYSNQSLSVTALSIYVESGQ